MQRYEFELGDGIHYAIKKDDNYKRVVLQQELEPLQVTVEDYYERARSKKATYSSDRGVWTYSFEL